MYALEVAHLSVHFEGAERPAVEDVSFALEPGQMIMLIGPNGSGKTTLLRAILGLIPSRGGEESTANLSGRPIRSLAMCHSTYASTPPSPYRPRNALHAAPCPAPESPA